MTTIRNVTKKYEKKVKLKFSMKIAIISFSSQTFEDFQQMFELLPQFWTNRSLRPFMSWPTALRQVG